MIVEHCDQSVGPSLLRRPGRRQSVVLVAAAPPVGLGVGVDDLHEPRGLDRRQAAGEQRRPATVTGERQRPGGQRALALRVQPRQLGFARDLGVLGCHLREHLFPHGGQLVGGVGGGPFQQQPFRLLALLVAQVGRQLAEHLVDAAGLPHPDGAGQRRVPNLGLRSEVATGEDRRICLFRRRLPRQRQPRRQWGAFHRKG